MTQHKKRLPALALVSEPDWLDVEHAAAYLASARNVDEIRDIRDKARAFEVYQRTRKASLEAQNDAAEIALRAERRLGELCATVAKRGKPKKSEMSSRTTLSELAISRDQSSRWQKLASIPEPDFEQHVTSVRARCEKLTTAGAVAAVSHSKEYDGDEWYTPPEVIEAAREVLGGIDLDPASHPIAQKTVKAARYFTKKKSGLDHEWKGNVWMNPPYSAQLARAFAQKLIAEIKAERVTAAILLQHNTGTDRAWFHDLVSLGCGVCFTKGRINFCKPDGTRSHANTQGSMFLYFGAEVDRFVEVFQSFGIIMWPDAECDQ